MRKLIALIILILLPLSAFSLKANIHIEVNEDKTYFRYNLSQVKGDELSIEKPKDSVLLSYKDQNNSKLSHSIHENFFTFHTKGSNNTNYLISFTSKSSSEHVLMKSLFSTYVNFKQPVDTLNVVMEFGRGLSKPHLIFPRDHGKADKRKVTWNLTDIESEQLFVVESEPSPQFLSTENIFFIILSIPVFFFVILTIYAGSKPIHSTNKKHQKSPQSTKEKQKNPLNIFADKFLTDNEKKVVEAVLKKEGIQQIEILDSVRELSNSSLSKIIAKLHSKDILQRVRVGKINKIYLGGKVKNSLNLHRKK